MTVLLVDDQISVISGLISGLDWDALGVTSIRTANSAAQAKRILLAEPVELLLCDIEMPGENGLALLRWARAEGMDFVCVFLTAHANFLYAKEAIQLNCFDYILQPARYEDIQAAVAKAIARVKKSSAERELEQYGAVAKNYSAGLFQNFFSDWSRGEPIALPALYDLFRQLGQPVKPEDQCFIILSHLLVWRTEPWPTQDWVYAVNNIVTELYSGSEFRTYPFGIDSASLGWLICADSGKFQRPEEVLMPINQAYTLITEHLPCDFAFYVGPVTPISQIDWQGKLLLKAKSENVLPKSGVFCPAAKIVPSEPSQEDGRFRVWETMLVKGSGETVALEAEKYLLTLNEEPTQLRGFWVRFQAAAMSAANTLGLDMRPLLAVCGADSLQEMGASVRRLVQCFPEYGSPDEGANNLTARVKRYVEENLDRPVNVNDVAAALFMNPDYISRQFKNETGIPLKEYIVRQKMESARALLQNTGLPIGVVAAKMGYDNFSYFSQVYRKVMGVSPTEERR